MLQVIFFHVSKNTIFFFFFFFFNFLKFSTLKHVARIWITQIRHQKVTGSENHSTVLKFLG